MTTERYARKLAKARKYGDIAAIAILEAGRVWSPEPAPERFVVKALTPLPFTLPVAA
jgi:hypothetical protein